MGTAEVQGELWGARAEDSAEAAEPAWRPVYAMALKGAGVGRGTRLLDIGCGAGGVLVLARALGAEVTGLDASENLVAVARQRLPEARIEVGDMLELPFPDETFDVVTGVNAFQFADDIVRALGEARRVCRKGGVLAMLVWGRREDCELISATMPAIFALLPPAPPPASPPPQLAEPGVIDDLMRQAGLSPAAGGDFASPLAFPDLETALRAILSAGVVVRAVRHAGEDTVRRALVGTLGRFTRPDGSVVQDNRFRWVTAIRE